MPRAAPQECQVNFSIRMCVHMLDEAVIDGSWDRSQSVYADGDGAGDNPLLQPKIAIGTWTAGYSLQGGIRHTAVRF